MIDTKVHMGYDPPRVAPAPLESEGSVPSSVGLHLLYGLQSLQPGGPPNPLAQGLLGHQLPAQAPQHSCCWLPPHPSRALQEDLQLRCLPLKRDSALTVQHLRIDLESTSHSSNLDLLPRHNVASEASPIVDEMHVVPTVY